MFKKKVEPNRIEYSFGYPRPGKHDKYPRWAPHFWCAREYNRDHKVHLQMLWGEWMFDLGLRYIKGQEGSLPYFKIHLYLGDGTNISGG